MKIYVLILIVAFASSTVLAQVEPEYRQVIRCIEQPSTPPEGWAFEGTIYTFRPGDGLHAFRTDFTSRYYVAFDSTHEFGYEGSFSPDGRYFSVYTIRSQYANMLDDAVFHTGLRIINTMTSQQVDFIDFEDYFYDMRMRYTARDFYNNHSWLDADHLIYSDGRGMIESARNIYSIESGESIPLDEQEHSPEDLEPNYRDMSESVDERYTIVRANSNTSSSIHIIDRRESIEIDTCIEPFFIYDQFAWSPFTDQVAFGLEEGGFVYILDVSDWAIYRLDLQANDVVAWYPSY